MLIKFNNCSYLLIFGCAGSSLLHSDFLQLRCAGFSLRWLLFCGERALGCGLSSCGNMGFVVLWHVDPPRPGSRPCPLCWQVDSSPLDHQGSPDLHQFFIMHLKTLMSKNDGTWRLSIECFACALQLARLWSTTTQVWVLVLRLTSRLF